MCVCACKRVRVSRILERRFTPRFSVPRGETPRKRPRPSLSSTPIFAQNPGFVTPREAVRRRNAVRVRAAEGFGLCLLLPG